MADYTITTDKHGTKTLTDLSGEHVSKKDENLNPLQNEKQPDADRKSPGSDVPPAPAATLAERALEHVGREGKGDQIRVLLLKDPKARHFEELEPLPGSPEVGDVAVLYCNANTPRCYGIVTSVSDGPWHELVIAGPLGRKDTVVEVRTSAAGWKNSTQAVPWDSSWKVAGFIRP